MYAFSNQDDASFISLFQNLRYDLVVGDMVLGAECDQDPHTDSKHLDSCQYQLSIYGVRSKLSHVDHIRLLYSHKGPIRDVQY